MIDNSQMFSFFPKKSVVLDWLNDYLIGNRKFRKDILIETAKRISALDRQNWYDLCKVPIGYEVDEIWNIREYIKESIKIAKGIVNENKHQ